jgi:retron-type reverse transcriptase
LQHALYRAAKANPGRRFHALFDKVHRRDVLNRAWEDVRRNRGAAGIDRVSLADADEYGVSLLLGELAAELMEKRYRPLSARRVFIPKPGTAEKRPLSIAAVRDRVVQAALKIVLEPVFRRCPLTRNEIAHLLSTMITRPAHGTGHWIRWSRWRRRHQHRARTCHYRRTAQDQRARPR